MLKGTEFGEAIRIAIDRKLQIGAAASKAEIARHFGVKPPSVADWVKKGSFSKDKLPELWRYFSDVAGPDHWGLTDEEWPAGLQAPSAVMFVKDSKCATYQADKRKPLKVKVETLSTAGSINGLTNEEYKLIQNFRKAPSNVKNAISMLLNQSQHEISHLVFGEPNRNPQKQKAARWAGVMNAVGDKVTVSGRVDPLLHKVSFGGTEPVKPKPKKLIIESK